MLDGTLGTTSGLAIFVRRRTGGLRRCLVRPDAQNKYKQPASKRLRFYMGDIMTKHFSRVDVDFGDVKNLNVFVIDIQTSWPKYIDVQLFNAKTRCEYKLQVERDSDQIFMVDRQINRGLITIHNGDPKSHRQV